LQRWPKGLSPCSRAATLLVRAYLASLAYDMSGVIVKDFIIRHLGDIDGDGLPAGFNI